MNITKFLTNYWQYLAEQNKDALRGLFHPNAEIYLHDTNEKLTVEELISHDIEQDENWHTTVDRIDKLENGQFVTITFHRSKSWIGFITSFFTIKDDKIAELHEYYSPCDEIPQWRTDLAEHEKIKP